VVDARLDSERVPAEREQPFWLDLFNRNLEPLAFVLFLGLSDFRIDSCAHDHAAHDGAGLEGAGEFHAEPLSECGGIGDCAPNACPGSAEEHILLNAVCVHMQPASCILARAGLICNLSVAYLRLTPPSTARTCPVTKSEAFRKYTTAS